MATAYPVVIDVCGRSTSIALALRVAARQRRRLAPAAASTAVAAEAAGAPGNGVERGAAAASAGPAVAAGVAPPPPPPVAILTPPPGPAAAAATARLAAALRSVGLATHTVSSAPPLSMGSDRACSRKPPPEVARQRLLTAAAIRLRARTLLTADVAEDAAAAVLSALPVGELLTTGEEGDGGLAGLLAADADVAALVAARDAMWGSEMRAPLRVLAAAAATADAAAASTAATPASPMGGLQSPTPPIPPRPPGVAALAAAGRRLGDVWSSLTASSDVVLRSTVVQSSARGFVVLRRDALAVAASHPATHTPTTVALWRVGMTLSGGRRRVPLDGKVDRTLADLVGRRGAAAGGTRRGRGSSRKSAKRDLRRGEGGVGGEAGDGGGGGGHLSWADLPPLSATTRGGCVVRTLGSSHARRLWERLAASGRWGDKGARMGGEVLPPLEGMGVGGDGRSGDGSVGDSGGRSRQGGLDGGGGGGGSDGWGGGERGSGLPSSPRRRRSAPPPMERAFVMIARESDSANSDSATRMGGNARSRSMGVGVGAGVYWDNRWGKSVDPPPLTLGGRILAAAVRDVDAPPLPPSPIEVSGAHAAGAPPSSSPSGSRSGSRSVGLSTSYTVRQLRTRDWQRLLERIPSMRYRSPPLDTLPGVPVIWGAIPGVAPPPAFAARSEREWGGREAPARPRGDSNGSTRRSVGELPVMDVVAAPHLGVNSVRGVTFLAVLLPRWRLLPPELDRGFSMADAVAEDAVGGS
ncbi:hypothetical protein MMPV_001752 [Pyropia vietnamensis]